MIVLIIAIKKQRFLYTITPEEQWKVELDKFDNNYQKLKELNITVNYKLGSEHIY